MENVRSPETVEESVQINHDGNMTWFTHNVLTYTCAMDMSNYPTDIQICPMTLMSTQDKFPAVIFRKVEGGVYSFISLNSEYNVTKIEVRIKNNSLIH